MAVLLVLTLQPNLVDAAPSSSSNFKLRADGVASAVAMNSPSFKLFSVAGDGRVVGISNSSNFTVSSSLVFSFRGDMAEEDLLCIPIRASNGAIAMICL